jgi:glucose-1-phosphate thymidylyltransferase
LIDAALFISTIEKRQGLKVSCPEEIAWRMGWVDNAGLERLAQPLMKNGYGQHLLDLLRERVY